MRLRYRGCREGTCFEEHFKRLADDESTLCRSCGNVT